MSQGCEISQSIRYDYAIGDIQGCYDGLMSLLDKIDFDDKLDRLWFVGDLVNRGPSSLAVLEFIKDLNIKPIITLGNHDLYLLSLIYLQEETSKKKDTLHGVLNSPKVTEIGDWLRNQSILYHDEKLNIVMSHAGIPPIWDLSSAKKHAKELETALASVDFKNFLENMLGNKPHKWKDSLTGNDRLRLICNYFTRMRFCKASGSLNLKYKGSIKKAPKGITPWFTIADRKPITQDIVFGHWASLGGVNPAPNIHAIDTGFVWGGAMTALRLQDKQRFKVRWNDIHPHF